MGLRTQLLLVSITILLLPWAGCQYVQEMEQVLRENQAQATLEKSLILTEMVAKNTQLPEPIASTQPVFYTALRYQPVQMDGYGDDWQVHHRHPLSPQAFLQKSIYQNKLYLFLTVKKDALHYHDPGKSFQYSDHVRLITQNGTQKYQWLFFTSAPGQLQVMRWQERSKQIQPDNDIEAWWQETATGFTVEIAVPMHKLLTHVDVETRAARTKPRAPVQIISSRTNNQPSLWLKPSSQYSLLDQHRRKDQDVVLVNPQGWPLSQQRNWLQESIELEPQSSTRGMLDQAVGRFYRMLVDKLTPRSSQRPWPLHGQDLSRYQDRFALENLPLQQRTLSNWYQIDDKNQSVLLTVQPLEQEGQLRGYLLLTQTADALISLTNRALQRVSHLTLVTMAVVIAILVLYASSLSWRIRSLKQSVEQSISGDGKVHGFQASKRGDEIGDLSRSYFQLLQRIQGYTDYLETLNGKLAHELRTPLAIVKSSLELVETQPDSEAYLQRAEQGVERLRQILSAMSEASRVEQTIQQSEMRPFDLLDLLQNLQQAYQDTYPDHQFGFGTPLAQASVLGSPELMAQLIDKLIDNARSFAPQGSTIELSLRQKDGGFQIQVANPGPPLPENLENQVFDSLVSSRTQGDNEAPHLGLGLFIVRLIAEAHGGRAMARNLPENKGVEFQIWLPATQSGG